MKRFLLIVLLLVSLLLPGCGTEQSGTASPYTSDTSAEDCYLCGGRIEDLIPSYWGQNNIALFSRNTFDIKPIEINRYTSNTDNGMKIGGFLLVSGGKTAVVFEFEE